MIRAKTTLFAFFIYLLMPCAHAGQINEIFFEGVPKNKFDYYKARVNSAIKQKMNLDNIEEVVDLLYRTETLSGIEVYADELENGKTNIYFKLFPKQTITKINFAGAPSYSRSDLLAELGLNEKEGYQEDRVKLGVDNLKKFYNLNGFLGAQVGAHFDQTDSGDLILNITVEEGPLCTVENINFISNNAKLNDKLASHIRSKIKKPFSQNLVNELQNELNEYLAEEKYYSSFLTANDVIYNQNKSRATLSFSVSEPYTYAIIFEDNEQFTDYQLLKELKLDQNNRLSGSPIDDLKERLIKVYKKKGYANVLIKHKESVFEQEFIRKIEFTILEGPKVKIKNIAFEGLFSRKPEYYVDYLFEHSGDLVSGHYYNSEDFEDGIKNLVTELQNQGFISAQVSSTRIDFDKRRESVNIKVVLNEGPQTFINKIIFNGANNISKPELQAVIGLQAGGPIQLSALADAATKIADYYRARGYLDVAVLNDSKSMISYFDDNKKADLAFEIVEGPLITVSSIVVEGNEFTKDYVILRELQFKPGEVLTPEKINYSEIRLQRLALFGSIEIRTLSDDPKEGKRAVLVVVSERNPGIFKSGIGADNELTLTLKGYVGAAYRNLFGSGRVINGRLGLNDKVKYSFFEKEITFGYIEPFLFNSNNNLRITASQSSKLYSITPDTTVSRGEKVFAIDGFQSDLILERDLTRNLKLLFQIYGLAHTNKYEIFGQAEQQPLDIATTGPSIIYDNRDSVFNPTKGIFTSISVEYSAPQLRSSDSVNYLKTVGNFNKYFSFGPFVFAQELKAGHIKNLGNNTAIPQVKAFILGGRSTIRGFEITETFPRADIEVINGISSSYNIFYLAKSELRFPLFGSFGGAIFYDGGHVQFPGFSQRFPWRDAAGVGIRYNTPVGPVSLEYSLKLNRDEQRSEGPAAFHFSIGVF